MKRVHATRDMTIEEMRELAAVLGKCGFPTAAVGKNYIAFYETVEIRRMIHGNVYKRGGEDIPPAEKTD